MTYSKDNLRQIFQQPFNQEGWKNMLRHYFHATELKAERERIDNTPDDEKGYYLGAIDTTDNYRIGLFYYQIQHGNVARKRVGLRNLVKSFINPNWGEFDAALVVFDSSSAKIVNSKFVNGKSTWRLSFVCDIKGENTAAKRFTYVFGESDNYYNTPVGRFDALQRNGISFENIKDAFSVERLNKDFFNGYKERYVKFLKHINDDTKENRDYVKKLLGRLVFLQFLQKKGWMGVPANQQGWNGGDKFYLNHLIESYEGNDRLLSDVLEPLFFNTLNERRTNDLADPRLGDNIKIPYLNGGLFDKDELDKKDIDFPYDYFKELMDFFAMYNFTIDENDPEDSEIGIDPEMLGHIFENLLEDNKDKGAFYTPKEIVQYMSKESVAQYLKSNTPAELHTAIDSLIKQRVVEPILQNKENARLVNKALSVVKVCDPAIGSGAFPMGVLNVLFDCRHLLYGFIGKNEDFSYAKVKRDIIQNNIYGVDIEKGAVDIARLRFWLALVVDENEPQPLPNLDYKIMCGDSLLHRFPLDAPFQNVLKDYNQKNGTHYTLDDYRQWVYDYTNISDHTQKDDFRKRIEDIKHAFKTELSDKEKGKIAKVRGTIENLKMEDLFGGKKKENEKKIKDLQKELKALEQQREEIESNRIYDQAFEWRFEFPALLDEDGNFTGFDIVIANPPYIRPHRIKDCEKVYLWQNYSVAQQKTDIYAFFIENGCDLLRKDGILSYIVPKTWNSIYSFKKLRNLLIYKYNVTQIGILPEKVFDNATVETALLFVENSKKESDIAFVDVYKKCIVSSRTKASIKSDADLNINIEETKETDSIPLGDLCKMIVGIVSGNDKKYCRHEKITDLDKPCIRGTNISRYAIDYSGEYIWYDREQIIWDGNHKPKSSLKQAVGQSSPKKPEDFELNEKIVMQRISKKIIAALDTNQYYVHSSVVIIKPNDKISLKFILAIINSRYVDSWLKKNSSNISINIGTVKKIPIPISTPTQQQPIIELVNRILQVKSNSSAAETKDLEDKIDLLVYHLYDLTYDEVLIVDPKTPITQEEYESEQ